MPGGLFKSRNLEGYTTAMNVSQREGLGADGIMANDSLAVIMSSEAHANPKSLAGRPKWAHSTLFFKTGVCGAATPGLIGGRA